MKNTLYRTVLFLLPMVFMLSLDSCKPESLEEITQKRLESIESYNSQGTFQDNWTSLEQFKVPEWYMDAKFGIFIHWGVYSVPAFGDEWYPKYMYIDAEQKSRKVNYYRHHLETYGPHDKFGYKDFIPMFKAEKFNATEWVELFKEAGARYVIPMAEHHDGFAMYKSSRTKWNSVEMGPERDVIGELREAILKEGLHFGLSMHRIGNWSYFPRADHYDTVDPENFGLYNKPKPYLYEMVEKKQLWGVDGLTGVVDPDREFMEDWLCRTTELVDLYKPELFWFDGSIGDETVTPYLKKFAAYYYNATSEKGGIGIVNYKNTAMAEGAGVLDLERGIQDDTRDFFWQTDDAVATKSWGYTKNNEYKSANTLVDDLVDIVSKNGCLLLNIGPKSDGTIDHAEAELLLEIGSWLKINGDAIYGSRPWMIYGEGPTDYEGGEGMGWKQEQHFFVEQDKRFTVSKEGNSLYVILLDKPTGPVLVKSLAAGGGLSSEIRSVSLLGSDEEISWSREADGLHLSFPVNAEGEYAFTYELLLGP